MFPVIHDSSNLNEIRARCEWGFVRTLEHAKPDLILNAKGYAGAPQDNLIPGIRLDDFRAAFDIGAGKEFGIMREGVYVPGKFCAAYSSSALAVNHFAPFASKPLPVLGSHRSLFLDGFEQTFPTGLRGTPPHLDALLGSKTARVAVESKCLEYLRAKSAKALEKTAARLRDKYLAGVTDDRCHSAWFTELSEMAADPHRYRVLDAAQLVKHALGLLNAPVDQPTTLLYLYWEPLDASLSPVFAAHRDEIARFGDRVSDDGLRFEAMSYPELWDQWLAGGDSLLGHHVTALRRRYAIPAFAWEGVSYSELGWTNEGLLNNDF